MASILLWNIKQFYPIVIIPIVFVVCFLFFLMLGYGKEERTIFKKGNNFPNIFTLYKFKI